MKIRECTGILTFYLVNGILLITIKTIHARSNIMNTIFPQLWCDVYATYLERSLLKFHLLTEPIEHVLVNGTCQPGLASLKSAEAFFKEDIRLTPKMLYKLLRCNN